MAEYGESNLARPPPILAKPDFGVDSVTGEGGDAGLLSTAS